MKLNKQGLSSPQQYMDLLISVLMTATGVQPHAFMLHAFMSVDVQELLPAGVRENLNRRNAHVHLHSPLGKSAQPKAGGPKGAVGGVGWGRNIHTLPASSLDSTCMITWASNTQCIVP